MGRSLVYSSSYSLSPPINALKIWKEEKEMLIAGLILLEAMVVGGKGLSTSKVLVLLHIDQKLTKKNYEAITIQ